MKKRFINILGAFCALTMLSGCGSSGVKDGTPVFVDSYKSGYVGNSGEVTLESGDTYAVITVENYGDITVKLFPDAAPVAVKNFIDLAERGYYDGTTVHRIVEDFMFQGGSASKDGIPGEAADGKEFACEINSSMRHYYGALCCANALGMNSCQFYIVNNKQPVTNISSLYDQYASYYEMSRANYEGYFDSFDKNSEEYKMVTRYVNSYKNLTDGSEFMKDTLTEEMEKKYSEVGGTPELDGGYTVFGQTVSGFEVIDAVSAIETVDNGNREISAPTQSVIISSVTINKA